MDPGKKGQSLEEDDEFEDFPAEVWAEPGREDFQSKQLWDSTWDDDSLDDPLGQQLRQQVAQQQQQQQGAQQQGQQQQQPGTT